MAPPPIHAAKVVRALEPLARERGQALGHGRLELTPELRFCVEAGSHANNGLVIRREPFIQPLSFFEEAGNPK